MPFRQYFPVFWLPILKKRLKNAAFFGLNSYPENTELIQNLIFQTHKKELGEPGRTTLAITHDSDLLRRLQPRVAMLHEGQVFFDGSYESFQQSDSPVIRPYFELMPILHQRAIPRAALGQS